MIYIYHNCGNPDPDPDPDLDIVFTRMEWQRLSQSSANSSHFVDGSDPTFQDGVRFEHLY